MTDRQQPQVSGPVTGGSRGYPFFSPMVDLSSHGYVEEEFFLEGVATRYLPRPGTELGRDGRWEVEPAGTAAYKTRIVVYRPSDPDRFSGVVFTCWNNVSGACDNMTGLTEGMLADGHAAVGVTVQRGGVHGQPHNHRGLVDWDPERYGSLFHPGDDYSYDIFTQAARAIGPDRDRRIDPMAGLAVRKLVANGSSQSAGRLGTYFNAVQPLARAYDGFVFQLYFGGGTPLEVGDEVLSITDPNALPAPENIVGSNLLRDDVDAKVMIVNSELEAIGCVLVRQPDTDRLRWWEAAGTAHVSEPWLHRRNIQSQMDFGEGVLCSVPYMEGMNRVPIGLLEDAAFHQIGRWVDGGPPPAIQPRIEFEGTKVVRDERGIARGGIRLPQIGAPLARHDAVPLAPGFMPWMSGSSLPFEAGDIVAEYGDEDGYMSRFENAAREACAAGVLLERSVPALAEEAREDFRAATKI